MPHNAAPPDPHRIVCPQSSAQSPNPRSTCPLACLRATAAADRLPRLHLVRFTTPAPAATFKTPKASSCLHKRTTRASSSATSTNSLKRPYRIPRADSHFQSSRAIAASTCWSLNASERLETKSIFASKHLHPCFVLQRHKRIHQVHLRQRVTSRTTQSPQRFPCQKFNITAKTQLLVSTLRADEHLCKQTFEQALFKHIETLPVFTFNSFGRRKRRATTLFIHPTAIADIVGARQRAQTHTGTDLQ